MVCRPPPRAGRPPRQSRTHRKPLPAGDGFAQGPSTTELDTISWRNIQAELLRRIYEREWPPGHLLPNETDLAVEFGCARHGEPCHARTRRCRPHH
ncbi:GntR family transcriptional regulator [Kaistia dalseonensis]|nr:GntR family transcriptional regulator [Kaistia dalseonensis]